MTEHVDMSQFIAARSDQLNADDLLDAPRTITITKVTASPDSAEQPVSIHYDGDGGKPFKPCKTVRRIMVGVWGKFASEYVGRSMTLYRDPTVAFGGMQVGGIRVSHMSHISEKKTVALQVTRGRKAPYTVHPLKQATAPAASEDPAAKWTTGYLAKLETLTDADQRRAFIDKQAPRVTELRTKRPELASRIDQALGESPATDDFDDDFGLDAAPQGSAPDPHEPEGRPDADMGEGFNTPDDHPARDAAKKIVSATKIARDAKGLENVRSKNAADMEALPADVRAEVEEAFRMAEQRVAAE